MRCLPAPYLHCTVSISFPTPLNQTIFFPSEYSIFGPLSFFIHFSLCYGVISVPVIQSEGQQKSLRDWNRLLSQAKSTDTFSAGITLFHYWQSSFSPFLSLNLLIYPHLCLYFYFSLHLPIMPSLSPSLTLSPLTLFFSSKRGSILILSSVPQFNTQVNAWCL